MLPVWADVGAGEWMEGVTKGQRAFSFWRWWDILIILIDGSYVRTYAQACQLEQFKYVQFIACQLHLTKAVF